MYKRKLDLILQHKVILVVIVLNLVTIFLSYSFGKTQNEYQVKSYNSKITTTNNATNKITNNSTIRITISAVGDITLGGDPRSSGSSSFDNQLKIVKYDYNYPFNNVKNIFLKDDLTIGNLEGPLTQASKNKEKKFTFKGKPAYTNILTDGGVDTVNLANNHSFDFGQQGYQDTKKYLEKAHIGYFGNDSVDIRKIKGIEIINLGYKGWDNAVLGKVIQDIKRYKKHNNIVIVTFHWGNEKTYSPTKQQITLAKKVIENGADLILGHHPHVLQGIQIHKNKHIVYSLGNFVFGGNKNPIDKHSMIYQETFIFDKNKKLIAKENKIIPVSISGIKTRNNYQPVILKGDKSKQVMDKIRKYSSKLNK